MLPALPGPALTGSGTPGQGDHREAARGAGELGLGTQTTRCPAASEGQGEEATQVLHNGQSFPVGALHVASREGWSETVKRGWGGPGLESCLASSSADVCALLRSQGWGMSVSHCLAALETPGILHRPRVAKACRSAVSQGIGRASSAKRNPQASSSNPSLGTTGPQATDAACPVSLL